MSIISLKNWFNCFKSYLTNRTQYVEYGITKSEGKKLHVVSHKAPFWDHCFIFSISMIYYIQFYLPMIPQD